MTTASLFLTPAEAGALMGCSAQTVRQMVRHGEVRAERHGRNFKIPRAEILRLEGQSQALESEQERRALYCRLLELQAEQAVIVAKLARIEA